MCRTMVAEGAFYLIVRRPGTYMAAAAMGFGVNALAYIVIQTSSSLTLKVHRVLHSALHEWGDGTGMRLVRCGLLMLSCGTRISSCTLVA